MPDILLVTWDRRRVSACQMLMGGRLVGGWTQPWPEGMQPLQSTQAAGEWLRTQWQSAGLTATAVWAIVPREEVVLRHLELPAVPDEELADMVKFQTASRSSVPLDQVCLDYLALPAHPHRTGRDVLAANIPKSLADGLGAIVAAAGRELNGVSFSTSALAGWTESMMRRRQMVGRVAMTVAWESGRVEFAVMDGEHLVYGHAVRFADAGVEGDAIAPVLSEASRTLVAAQRLRPELSLDHLWAVGTSESLTAALGERTGAPAERVDASDGLADWSPSASLRQRSTERALLLGQAALSQRPAPVAVDFLHPRQPPPKRDPRKFYYAVGSAGALLALCLIGGTALGWQSALDHQKSKLEEKKLELDRAIKAGTPRLEEAKLVGDWTQRNINQFEQLVELETLLPGNYERPYFSGYQYTVSSTGETLGRLVAVGAAKTEEQITQFKERVAEQSHYSVQPRPVGNTRDDGYPKLLDLNADRRPPKPQPNSQSKPKT